MPQGKTMWEVRSFYINRIGAGPVFRGIVERQIAESDRTPSPDWKWQDYRLVTIRPSAVYRGPKQERYVVKTGIWGYGDCGFDFETGEDYLIYADKDNHGGLLVNRCSGTRLAEFAETDLRILRGQAPSPDDLLDEESFRKKFQAEHLSSVCGQVSREDRRPVNAGVVLSRHRHDGFPPKGYPADERYSEIKADGTFCVEHVRHGNYILSAKDVDPSTDIQFAGKLSNIHVDVGKNVTGLNLVLHRDLLYSVRRHMIVLAILAAAVILIVIVTWALRRKMRGSVVPTSR